MNRRSKGEIDIEGATGMTSGEVQFTNSIIVWGSIAAVVLTIELLAWRDIIPVNTLTWTIRQLSVRSFLVYPALMALLLVFALHIRRPKAGTKNQPEGENRETEKGGAGIDNELHG